MSPRKQYTAEWLEKNCDIEVPFERAVKVELGRLLKSNDELKRVLRLARANLAAGLEMMAMIHHNPVTGTVDDAEVLLIIEAEQDLINQIDAAIAEA